MAIVFPHPSRHTLSVWIWSSSHQAVVSVLPHAESGLRHMTWTVRLANMKQAETCTLGLVIFYCGWNPEVTTSRSPSWPAKRWEGYKERIRGTLAARPQSLLANSQTYEWGHPRPASLQSHQQLITDNISPAKKSKGSLEKNCLFSPQNYELNKCLFFQAGRLWVFCYSARAKWYSI